MTDSPDSKAAQADGAGAGDVQPAGHVQPAADPEQAELQPAGATRAPGPGAPPPGRPAWATGNVGFPTLLGGLVVALGAALGLTALGGWAGIAGCAVVVIAMTGLVVAWAE